MIGAPIPKYCRPNRMTGLLDELEHAWQPRARSVSLVIEVEINDTDLDESAYCIGALYEKTLACGGDPRWIVQRWPACTAVTVASIANRDYEHGSFWPAFWEAIGFRGQAVDQKELGECFHLALEILWLPTFPAMGQHWLGPILMHAGIPAYCVRDFLLLMIRRMAADPGIDAESFMAWAAGPETRLSQVDMPVQRFLQYGSDYAYDVVDRSLDLLRRLRGDLDTTGAGLPRRFVDRALDLLADQQLDVSRAGADGGPATGGRAAERPRLHFDPFGSGVGIALPAVPGAAEDGTAWQIAADGADFTHRVRASWDATGEGAPSAIVALHGPCRLLVVRGEVGTTELSPMSSEHPMLAFTDGGRFMAVGATLPPDPVWLVHPANAELALDGPRQVVAEAPLAAGWSGWQAELVNLDGVRSVGLIGYPATRREVRGFQSPRIDASQLLPGLATTSGLPVAGTPPSVWLPDSGNRPIEWIVEICGPGGVLVQSTMGAGLAGTDPWADVPRPLLGPYTVTARGPLGRSVSRTIFVADKIGIAYQPAVRTFNSHGVVAARARLDLPVGVNASETTLTFGPAELARIVELRAGTGAHRLVVTPPHPRVLHEAGSAAAAWSSGPVSLVTENFRDDPGSLVVSSPTGGVAPIRVLVGGIEVQQIAPRRLAIGTARYPLAQAADTIIEHRHADIVTATDDGDLPLAFVRPRRLAESAQIDGDRVELAGSPDIAGLKAGLYLTNAPWRPPVVVEAHSGSVPVPIECRDAGPVVLHLQVDSPWTFTEWPRWPDGRLVATATGHLRSADAEETAVSRYLAGDGDFPERIDDHRRLWVLADLAKRLRPEALLDDFLNRIGAPLRRDPGLALTALAAASLGMDRTAGALIGTGMAAAAKPAESPVGPAMWISTPLAAALLSGRSPDDAEWLHAAEQQCGSAFAEIVKTGTDPFGTAGRFDSSTLAFAQLPMDRQEDVLRHANLVPRSLLDADNRSSAALELFQNRLRRPARNAGAAARTTIAEARTLLDRHRLLAQVVTRRHPGSDEGGWMLLPTMSLSLAIAARLAAYGDDAARELEARHRAVWRQLAEAAPRLTTIDLILAELLVTERKGHTP
jgi:hypothetical protein